MIRTTREASLFGLWRDADVLRALGQIEFLTTARYEPVCRNALGTGLVDLLFETPERSCVIGGIRLDPNSLITRERSPLVWPAHLAGTLDADRLRAIEAHITPWLRSIARARPMARESIRRFVPSQRFERARDAELLGAAPLAPLIRRMAPFVYARRFVRGCSVSIDCDDAALGHAVLADLAGSITHPSYSHEDDPLGDRAFARDWYGVAPGAVSSSGAIDVAFARGPGLVDAAIVIEASFCAGSNAATIDVPSPAPLDLLFAFDAADAPLVRRFSVNAIESPLRPCPVVELPRAIGGSAGRIVLALSPEALAMGGADVEEVELLERCLTAEGLTVSIEMDAGAPLMARAELVHIFGGAYEAHTLAFASVARERGIDFVLDVAPRPQSPSAFIEDMLLLAMRAASDDAETARYLRAYESREVTGTTVPEPSAEEFSQREARFAELASSAVAVLATEEDVAGLRSWLPPPVAGRVLARGAFASPEPLPASIGHLVPSAPFAFVHGPIAGRSHALFAAIAAERRRVPLVIAGRCHDVDYLQTLRTIAPSAVVLADPDAAVVSAIYRRATIWIDTAPRPRSTAGLLRAVACGALPVLARESPLALIAGPDAPTFPLTSIEDCANSLVEALTLLDRDERVAALQTRLAPRRNLPRTFGALLEAYARVEAAV